MKGSSLETASKNKFRIFF